jgi:hypothetical protein
VLPADRKIKELEEMIKKQEQLMTPRQKRLLANQPQVNIETPMNLQ